VQVPDNPLDGDLNDARIGAIVSLDLGLARCFTPESLATLHVPALILGAGVDIGDLRQPGALWLALALLLWLHANVEACSHSSRFGTGMVH
jgi:predicted dienelactone hydrolase